jgi:hypothetical protein
VAPVFNLDGYHPGVWGFEDGIYLHPVLGAVVMEAGPFGTPGELAGQFHQHEGLDHRPCCSVRFAEVGGVLA